MTRPALTRRVALTLLSLLACITAAFAPGGGPSDIGDEPPTQQQGQDFVCDLNDGRIDVEVLRDGTVRYERDTMYGAFNIYRGELEIMVGAGIYTQDLAPNSGASHWCDATSGWLMDGYSPPLGHIAFYVGTGTRTDGESFPGQNSAHTDRPHHHPCHPCDANGDCASGSFCAKAPGNCGGHGVCTHIPSACPDVWLPVCGCDGVTYSNSCDAAAAGASIQHQGACEQPCTSNAQCAATDYCVRLLGDCSGAGHCEARPQACTTLWMPVCGCDGHTYSNACVAQAAGVTILQLGECTAPAGCASNAQCAATEFCAKSDGACSELGQCTPLPATCPPDIDLVCGCDGKTYQNSVFANSAGTSVASYGGCPCESNGDCVGGQFCLEMDCEYGSCADRPIICPDVVAEVCGCDGRIHQNACIANRNGTSVGPWSRCTP